MSIFEAIMLICFGISWPISIVKTIRTKHAAGKSPLFMSIVIVGYISGITHKWVHARDWIILLYIFNFVMVAIDLALYQYFTAREARTDALRTCPNCQSEV